MTGSTVCLDFWIVDLVFSFGGHTGTYRMVSAGYGAFELCLPSLGFFFTKLTLRCLLLGQRSRMAPSWVKVLSVPDMNCLQQDAVLT